MKLIVKLDPTFGQMLKLIKTKVNNLIYRWFKKPYNDYVQRRLEHKRIRKLHNEFTSKFNMRPDEVVELMRKSDASADFKKKHPSVKMTDSEYQEFLREELKKSAVSFNEMRRYIKASFFYEPEICDIHNEALTEHTGPSLKELIAKENKASEDALRYKTKEIPLLDKINSPKTLSQHLGTRQTDLAIIKKADSQVNETKFNQFKDILKDPDARKIFE